MQQCTKREGRDEPPSSMGLEYKASLTCKMCAEGKFSFYLFQRVCIFVEMKLVCKG